MKEKKNVWKDMTWSQRAEHFFAYYKFHAFVAIVSVILVIQVGSWLYHRTDETLLYAVLVDRSITLEESEQLEEMLFQLEGGTDPNHQKVVVDSTVKHEGAMASGAQDAMIAKQAVLFQSGTADLFFCPEAFYRDFQVHGVYCDLRELLDESYHHLLTEDGDALVLSDAYDLPGEGAEPTYLFIPTTSSRPMEAVKWIREILRSAN